MKFGAIARSIAVLAAAALVFVAAARDRSSVQAAGSQALIVSLEGVVAGVEMGISQEFPAFELAQTSGGSVTIMTGPYYVLVDSGFDIRVGDRMSVRAYPSLWHEDAYVAIELNNLTTAETLVLRDSSGRPLWTNRGGPGDSGMGQCPGAGGERMSIVTLEGIAVSLNMGPGLSYPSFDLALVDGTRLTIMVGPYRYLVDSGFAISPGDGMKVAAFKSTWPDNTYVAVELTQLTSGETLALRDAYGQPIWADQSGGGKGGPGGSGSGGAAAYRGGDCTGWIPPEGSIDITTLEGFVVNVDMECLQEFPSFELVTTTAGVVTIVTGPYYLLLQSGFDLNVGDRMRVLAYESHWYVKTFVAVELTNLASGDTLVLRDAAGHPTWPNAQGFANAGIGYGGGGAWLSVDPAAMVTIKGTIESMTCGLGEGYLSVTIAKSSGTRMAVIAGPYRFLLENEFQMRVGDSLKLTAFPSGWFDNVYVAAKVKNRTTGRSLIFRDEQGMHLWAHR